MSGNSHDRRKEARGLNYMQRVFDALKAHPGRTEAELAASTSLAIEAVHGAIRRLRLTRSITSQCLDREWRYRLAAGAVRPVDRRGGGIRRQMMQAIAA